MSAESSIKCPNCGELINVNELFIKNIDLIILGCKYAKN